jgi:hypothetical protein
MMGTAWRKPRRRGFAALRSSILVPSTSVKKLSWGGLAHSVVLMLSNGVTASNDSVTPAPKPAITVRGPEMLPSASCNIDLYWSNATNRTPAFRELPIIRVVQPAYHAGPNFGHGSLSAPDNRWLSCVRVLATVFLSISPHPQFPQSAGRS